MRTRRGHLLEHEDEPPEIRALYEAEMKKAACLFACRQSGEQTLSALSVNPGRSRLASLDRLGLLD